MPETSETGEGGLLPELGHLSGKAIAALVARTPVRGLPERLTDPVVLDALWLSIWTATVAMAISLVVGYVVPKTFGVVELTRTGKVALPRS